MLVTYKCCDGYGIHIRTRISAVARITVMSGGKKVAIIASANAPRRCTVLHKSYIIVDHVNVMTARTNCIALSATIEYLNTNPAFSHVLHINMSITLSPFHTSFNNLVRNVIISLYAVTVPDAFH